MSWNYIQRKCLSRGEEKNWTSHKAKEKAILGGCRWIISWCSWNSRAWTARVGARVRVQAGAFGEPVDLVCDILALHLVQVVLSPQSPLGSPEDMERVALTLCCGAHRKTPQQILKASTIFASQHFANSARITCFHLDTLAGKKGPSKQGNKQTGMAKAWL